MTDRMLPRAMVRDVWGWLRARDARPRPAMPDGRGEIRVVALDGGQATDIYLYDEIGWFGITAADVVNELLGIGTPRITVRINSPGGDVFDGIAIYNALMEHPATIDVQVDGLAASIASMIAMAGPTRTMKTGTQMMIHDAHVLVMGPPADLRKQTDLVESICDEMAAIYAARAGGEAVAWRAAMVAETWYTAAEAVTAGLATAGPAAATTEDEDGPHLVPAAKFNLNLTSFLYAGRAAAPPPAPIPATVAVAAGTRSTPAAAENRPGWTDLDPELIKIAAAFAGVNPNRKEAAR